MFEFQVLGHTGQPKTTLSLDEIKAMRLKALTDFCTSLQPGYTRRLKVDGYGEVRIRRMS